MRFGDIAFMDYLKFKSGTDVRGTAVNGDFTPEVAANIAAAFAFVFDCKRLPWAEIVVSQDRKSAML